MLNCSLKLVVSLDWKDFIFIVCYCDVKVDIFKFVKLIIYIVSDYVFIIWFLKLWY